ncbi:MAG: hypothetical protein V4616_05565, partial [Bacteroidota bacterium]
MAVIAQSHTIRIDRPAELDRNQVIEEFPLQSAGDASFIGLTAYSHDQYGNYVLYFSYRENGSWSAWKEFKPYTESLTEDRRSFEADPLPSTATAVRFAKSGNCDKPVFFRIFYPEHSAVNESPAQPSSAACNCTTPTFCDRSCWCPSGDCPEPASPTPTTATHIIVHHSAGFNTSTDFKAVVAYYWDFHVNTNGWDDIGYNW